MTERTAEDRADALAQAFSLLDTLAGEGVGHVYGNGQQLFADDVVAEIAEAFDFEPEPGWWRTLGAQLASEHTTGEAMREAVKMAAARVILEQLCLVPDARMRTAEAIADAVIALQSEPEREAKPCQPSDEDVERVARAIAARMFPRLKPFAKMPNPHDTAERYAERAWGLYADDARAAIRAWQGRE